MALQGELEDHGGTVVFGTSVEYAQLEGAGVAARASSVETLSILCSPLIYAADFAAIELLRNVYGHPADILRHPFHPKGCSFVLDGATRLGLNVVWSERPEYSVSPQLIAESHDSIRRCRPALADVALHAGYALVHPKAVGSRRLAAYFVIEVPETHGRADLVNPFGMKSPDNTTALANREHVATLLDIFAASIARSGSPSASSQ